MGLKSFLKQGLPATVAQSVEYPLWGTVGHGFDPRPQHTKVVKMVLATPRWHSNLRGRAGLIDPVSGLGMVSCDWVWYHVRCLGHDTSVRQHIKLNIELPVAFRRCHEKLLKATLNQNN